MERHFLRSYCRSSLSYQSSDPRPPSHIPSIAAYGSSLSFPTSADGMSDENPYQMGFDSGFQRAMMLMSGMGGMDGMRGMGMGMMHAGSDGHTSNTVIPAAPRGGDMKKPPFVLHFFLYVDT